MVMKNLNYNTGKITAADEQTALDNISCIEANDFNKFAPVPSGTKPTGFNGIGAIFQCKSASVVNVTFTLQSGHTIDEYNITCTKPNGQTVTITPVASGTANKYTYAITGLKASQLDDQYTFTVKKKTGGSTYSLKISAMSFFYAQRNSSDPNVTNLGKAVYLYNQAADA